MNNEILYQIALTKVPQIGSVQAKLLVEELGSAQKIFESKKSTLEKIEGIGPARAKQIRDFKSFQELEEELKFIEKFQIQTLFLSDAGYPQKLLQCTDPPTLLYYKGTAHLNNSKAVAIIGTRSNSELGRELTEQLIDGLKPVSPLIVSGLAYGIDIIAHKKALKLEMETVAVLAHGLHTIYPYAHKKIAKEMIYSGGGLLSEFGSGIDPERHHFPSRNRIVAGLCDVTVIIESGVKGGSMVTAQLANGYHRDVMAFPGRVIDLKSSGCNELIKQQRAQLITGAADLLHFMGWQTQSNAPAPQSNLFVDLSPDESVLYNILNATPSLHVDELRTQTSFSPSKIAALLLEMELKQLVQSLPGKHYKLRI
ncbi:MULTISPECIES: DNA-processing protein DprA [unclassified Paraflavitalea]|uniref:DNA-processing protein DprA n=1 Tax=unclassified Paraflavitalea TaxID=2798305 RepID=UPI003D3406B6